MAVSVPGQRAARPVSRTTPSVSPESGQLSAHLSAGGFRITEHEFRASSGCLFPCPVARRSDAG